MTRAGTPRSLMIGPITLSVMGACSALTGEQGNCSAALFGRNPKPSHSSGSSLFQLIESSHLKGGWIEYEKSTCTATLEFSESPDENLFVVHAWTGRHCGYDVHRSTTHPTLKIHFGDGYQSVQAIDDVIFRRQAALELANERGAQSATIELLETAFEFETGRQRNKEDTGCYNSDKAKKDWDSGKHVFCANWLDLGYYKFFIEKDKLPPFAVSYIKGSITATQNVREDIRTVLEGVNLDGWSTDLKTVWQIQRLKHNAAALDQIGTLCSSPDGKSPLCQDKEVLLEIASRYFFEGDKSLLGFAKANGMASPDGRFPISTEESALTNHLKAEEARLRTSLTNYWKTHGRELLSQSDGIWLHTNVDAKDGVNFAPRFETVPFRALYSRGLELGEITNQEGLQVAQPISQTPVTFSEKDSGSILSIFGQFPILALSGADGQQTSGSESLGALPAASGTATELSPMFAEKEKFNSGRTVTPDTDQNCQ